MVGGEEAAYRRIAAAIVEDYEAGVIPPGARLPAQRELAYQLSVGVGTVTKAYSLLCRQGFGHAVKGSAMYVTKRAVKMPSLELHVNVPPNLMSGTMLSQTLNTLAATVDERDLTRPIPYEGSEQHRSCLATWLQSYCASIQPDSMILCNGGQHAIWMALTVLAEAPTVVLTDEIPFNGIRWIADALGLELRGVANDQEGLVPEALEQAIRQAAADGFSPVLYCSPTAQNPTAVSMSNSRLEEIAGICRKNALYVIEDDVYAAFAIQDHSCLLDHIPDQTFYVNSLAKILTPWFRLGVLVTPKHLFSKCMDLMHAHGSKVSPIMTHVMQEWITSGLASEVAYLTHKEGIFRNEIAAKHFANSRNALVGNGFHMFLSLPYDASSALCSEAGKENIKVGEPAVNLLGNHKKSGVRLCLGGLRRLELETALQKIASLNNKLSA